MKILHIINDLSILRGAERVVSELVSNCEDHSVVSFRLKGDYRNFPKSMRYMRVDSFFKLILFLIINRNKYDVFHFHLFPSFYLSFIVGGKSIIHEHGNGTNNRRHGKWPFYLIEWFLFRSCGFVLAVSDEAKRNILSKYPFLSRKIDVIPNFLPPSLTLKHSDLKDRKVETALKVGMIAAFVPGKRHDIVLKAISQVNREVELHLVGSGALISECKNLASILGVEDRVEFHGSINDVSWFYRDCDVFLLLSDFESFGLVVLEAASFGKRTICSNIEGLNSVCPVDDDLIENSVEELVQAIERFDRDSCFDDDLDSIVKKYSFEIYVKKLSEIYEMICDKRG